MEDLKPLITQIESWLQTFVAQNSKSDFRGCRSTLRVLDKLYEKLDEKIQDETKLQAKADHYKPMTQL